jgi:hypothetical protein
MRLTFRGFLAGHQQKAWERRALWGRVIDSLDQWQQAMAGEARQTGEGFDQKKGMGMYRDDADKNSTTEAVD